MISHFCLFPFESFLQDFYLIRDNLSVTHPFISFTEKNILIMLIETREVGCHDCVEV